MTWGERLRAPVFVALGLATRAMTLGVKAFATDGGRVMLVRHTYVSGWHLPGGGVERRETVWQAVDKELREETSLRLVGRPELWGFYKNERTSRFDHIAMFVVREFEDLGAFTPTREIAEARWFAFDALPPDATEATRARVAEVRENRHPADRW